MILNLVPSTLLSTVGYCSIDEVTPDEPTIICFTNMSSNVLIGDVCQATQMLVSLLALPTNWNWRGSNWVCAVSPRSGSITAPMNRAPKAVPSLGDLL